MSILGNLLGLGSDAGGLSGLLGLGGTDNNTSGALGLGNATDSGGGLLGLNLFGVDNSMRLPMALSMLGGGSNSQAFTNAANIYGSMAPKIEEKRLAADQKNKTLEFMRQNNPEIAAMVDAGMPISEAWKQVLEARKGGTGTEVYGTPIYGKDKDGRTVLGAMTKDGRFQALDTGGVDVTPGVTWQDFGTHRQAFDRAGNPVGAPVPIDNRNAAADTAGGRVAGEEQEKAKLALGSARQNAAKVNMMVTDLKNDPYLSSMIGPVASRLPNVSGDAARVQARIEQLSGEAFLQARQMLKGGGAITDFESTKAEQAFIRLNQAQNLEDFKAALDEFNQAVQTGLQKLEASAGMGGQAPVAGSAPVDLKSKYGLE